VQGEELRIVLCEFQGGVGLNKDDEIFKLSEDVRKFAFNLPAKWFQARRPSIDVAKITWKNMVKGWDGEATALLNGELISIVETQGGNNGFYTAVWPYKKDRNLRMQSILVVVGHDDLPKTYETSHMRRGQCY
jgi:hypothetical protein